MSNNERPIIVKRIKKVSGGHHGGAWKVAYADFTTAMMAFFMLLWLLNATTEEQKAGLAEYFSPTSASTSSSSGSGDILGGSSMSPEGALNNAAVTISIPTPTTPSKETSQHEPSAEEKSYEQLIAEREQEVLEAATEELKLSIQAIPELRDLHNQILIDITEDGMRIQLIDQNNKSMFKPGSAELYNYAKKVLRQISLTVGKLPNRISISGHTDATPLNKGNYSNWELSSDRANAARRVLMDASVSTDRFSDVMGKAATEPLLPDSPYRAENRRITILLMREAPVLPHAYNQ
ncbi:MAG: motility protein MotB [Kordiimonas sp.]|nr:motility protein MotB [Kordiimonas sp.]|tara:strand:- start:5401 stop:6279 length:879 start_codon:yes stop_codon:yes gene_type:complete